MSSGGNADHGAASRRERAAHAAERRISEYARGVVQRAALSCMDGSSDKATSLMNQHEAPVASKEGMSSSHISFSDSDGDNVTCIGVVPNNSDHYSRTPKCEPTAAEGVRGDQTNNPTKRRRKNEPATTSMAFTGASLGTGPITTVQVASACASKRFRMVSWNVDCLNPANKLARIDEVCSILLEDDASLPDAILLQEVDDESLATLNARLGVGSRYRSYPMRAPKQRRYFTKIFTRASTVTVEDDNRRDFPLSSLERDLSAVRCRFNGVPLLLLTSHLESEKHRADERKWQFSQVLRELLDFRDGPAIFAGDTNLRELEVKQEKLSKEAGDMWIECGANPKTRFTWDMANNDNLVLGFHPRARYDRAFLNPQAKQYAKSFALLGTERMASPHACFPSDHFGIDCIFEW